MAAFGAGEAGTALGATDAPGVVVAGLAVAGVAEVAGLAPPEGEAALGEGEAASGVLDSEVEPLPNGKLPVKKSPASARTGTNIPTGIAHLGNCFFGGGCSSSSLSSSSSFRSTNSSS